MSKSKDNTTESTPVRKISELLKSQTNVLGQENSLTSSDIKGRDVEDISEHKRYKDTPFFIRKIGDSGYFATLGKYRVTDEEPTKEAIEDIIDSKEWEFLLTCVTACVNGTLEELNKGH